MTDAVLTAPPRGGFARQTATRVAFFVAGFSMSAWAPLIPYAKTRLQISDGHLGLLLLCLGTGSVVGMPAAGGLAARLGCRAVIVTAGAVACLMLPVMAWTPSVALLAAALMVLGAAIGSLDVVMNIHAVLVERYSGRSMMSGFHGMYSVGGIAGAGLVSLMTSVGTGPVLAAALVSSLTLAALAASAPGLLDEGGDSDGPSFALPRGKVLLLGCFCFVMFLAEGSVLDWSGVLLTTLRQVDEKHAGIGYVAFAAAMTVCRLTGDAITRRAGPARVVLFGTVCAASGFLLAAFVPSAAVSVIGFALVGVGASNVVPVMFSAAGRQTSMPVNLAIPAITTLGYLGILMGPALVGLFANYLGLRAGLALIALMLLAVAVTSPRARFGAV